jgi:dihydropteroate synthase
VGYGSQVSVERVWRLADRELRFGPPLGVGIVNVTDDSFHAGARSGTPARAVADGRALVEAGFDLLDVGAVAARSGPPVSAEEEGGRLVPTIAGLAAKSRVAIAADTFSAQAAAAALDAGAVAINDISGGADPELVALVAERGCGYVLMHIEGPPRVDRDPPGGNDAVARVLAWFEERVEWLVVAGVELEHIVLDPGFDFDLTVDDDLELLRRLGELRVADRPLFAALSRKDFLGAVLAGSWEDRAPASEREWATAGATALAVDAGADLVRLHDRSALDALRVAAAVAHPAAAAVG